MSPSRYQRIREMLAMRQTDLTVLMEEVHKPHNVSAILRTCDAVGVHEAHAVWENNPGVRRGTSMGATDWLTVHAHDSVETAVASLKAQNMQVLVTHLSDTAIDFREVDYTRPTAIIMGQEKNGVTPEALAVADQDIVIPMVGMTQSLNVSVAAALVLYEAQRQRQNAGMYQTPQLSEEVCQKLLFKGGHPTIYRQWLKHDLPLPHINEAGEIEASSDWWECLQYARATG